MKKYTLLFIVSFTFSLNGLQAKVIEEQVYIKDLQLLKYVETQTALTIDHVSDHGFELYGPKGLKKWLDGIKAPYLSSSGFSFQSKDLYQGYPSFKEIENSLKNLVAQYPAIAKLISIGKSVEGRDLWVVKISDNVQVDELEPEFKYISSMHGNEITGRELTQFFIRDLLDGYGTDKKITDLIDNTEIYIMPSMNPDGSKRKKRSNANGVDLNRDFPDWSRGDSNSNFKRQPETLALMKFQKQRNFSLSANFHGGAVVVNYPWDSSYKRHPLDSLVQDISLEYANLNPEMKNSRRFKNGITNGADWYVLKGGMQDWSYFFYNDLQVTIELSDEKWPRYSELKSFYKINKDSMFALIKNIHQGFGFHFEDLKSQGTVKVFYSDLTLLGKYTFSKGEFYKVLAPGNYHIEVETKGIESQKHTFSVNIDNTIKSKSYLKLL